MTLSFWWSIWRRRFWWLLVLSSYRVISGALMRQNIAWVQVKKIGWFRLILYEGYILGFRIIQGIWLQWSASMVMDGGDIPPILIKPAYNNLCLGLATTWMITLQSVQPRHDILLTEYLCNGASILKSTRQKIQKGAWRLPFDGWS